VVKCRIIEDPRVKDTPFFVKYKGKYGLFWWTITDGWGEYSSKKWFKTEGDVKEYIAKLEFRRTAKTQIVKTFDFD
tara:strand:- start:561 stop:788 length:228 start_codon:yes stop_codon:yes gene_type:complete